MGTLTFRFNINVKDHKGCENQVLDHLYRYKSEKKRANKIEIDDSYLYKQALAASHDRVPCIANVLTIFLAT